MSRTDKDAPRWLVEPQHTSKCAERKCEWCGKDPIANKAQIRRERKQAKRQVWLDMDM